MPNRTLSQPAAVAPNLFSLFDFFAGGISGITAKTLTAPIERVKLLLQTANENTRLKTRYTGIVDCFTRCVKQQGVLSLWRGNGVNVIRYFPTQALNFSFKDFYGRLLNIEQKKANKTNFLFYNIACGGMAGCTTTLFVHPLDFARTRMAVDLGRLKADRQYSGLWNCLQKVYRSDGVRGLYSGFLAAFLGMFVYRGLYFGVYDFGKKTLLTHDSPILLKLVWAQISVIVAQQISYPGDTVKRKLFMQACKKQKEYTGIIDCFSKVYRAEGMNGLFRGAYSNILRGIGSSLCLIIYDEIKLGFGKTV